MERIPELIVTGILTGSVYGLLAMGLSLQYGVCRVLNVSHGEFVMLGATLTVFFHIVFDLDPLVAVAIIGPVLFGLGFLFQITLFRGLKARAVSQAAFEGNALLLAFALMYIIQSIARVRLGGTQAISLYFTNKVMFAGMSFSVNQIIAFAVSVALGVAVYLFLNRTRLGRAIRATAEEPSTAGLMGVNVKMVLAFCFGLGALLAGVAGTLISLRTPVDTNMGFGNTVIALVVVTLGGLGSVPGSFVAGIVIGIVSRLVGNLWEMVLVIPVYYAILMVLLLIRPAGILGKK